jgi:GTP-binding protein
LDYVIKKGKGLILLVNKWDLVDKDTHTMKDFTDEIAYQFRSLAHYPILFISALTKQRISKVLGIAHDVYESRKNSITTSKLNKFLRKLIARQSPPATHGKIINLNYMTQVHSAPHLFVIFSNQPKLVPMSYRRFIENQLREQFDLLGIPIRISFRRK